MRAWEWLCVAVFVLLGTLLFPVRASAFSGAGTGSEDDPFKITTCLQLQEMNQDLEAHYRLMNNVNCGDGAPAGNNTRVWNEDPDAPGEYFGFEPIGYFLTSDYFEGSLDGNGKTITGLYVNRPEEVSVGLFDTIFYAAVSNLTLNDIDMEGGYFVSGLVGLAGFSEIERVSVGGESEIRIDEAIDFDGAPYPPLVGGLVGYAAGSTIQYCFSDLNIIGLAEEGIYGGLVGANEMGYLVFSGSEANVIARGGYIGGFLGTNSQGLVGGSYSKGVVIGLEGYIGGFVGFNLYQMTDNYSLSTLAVPAPFEGGYVGGFAGVNIEQIDNSYFAGSLTISSFEDLSDEDNIGAFAGLNNGDIEQVFWNTETAGDWPGCGQVNGPCSGISGKTTAELKTLSTFTTNLDYPWDFENIWDMNGTDNDGYPFFRWFFFEEEPEEEDPEPTPTPEPDSEDEDNDEPHAPVCTDARPAAVPDLFQISREGENATLYFTPLSDTSRYFISYATEPSAEEYGVEVKLGRDGVQNYTIGSLVPGTEYYFKVRGQHGCMPGPWSAVKSTAPENKNEAMFEFVIEEESSSEERLNQLFHIDDGLSFRGEQQQTPSQSVQAQSFFSQLWSKIESSLKGIKL